MVVLKRAFLNVSSVLVLVLEFLPRGLEGLLERSEAALVGEGEHTLKIDLVASPKPVLAVVRPSYHEPLCRLT